MFARIVAFNAFVGVIVVVSTAVMVRRPRFGTLAGAVSLAGTASFVSAMVLGVGRFQTIQLFAWAVFLHGIVFLGGVVVAFRRTRGAISWTAAVASLALLAVAVDAFWVEPKILDVSRYQISSAEISRRVRIGVLADIQTDSVGDFERQTLDTLRKQRPDLLLLAGDYLQIADPKRYAIERGRMRALFAGVTAPLGVFAVRGNTDSTAWPSIFTGLPVRILEATETVSGGPIRIVGLSVEDSFRGDLSIAEEPGFTVVLGHSPDFALGDVRADLLVAGHTHGGQVRLPLVGPLITLSQVPRAWAAGRTQLAGGRTLIVSRGTGMERGDAPRIRFLCRPEIVVIDLVPR